MEGLGELTRLPWHEPWFEPWRDAGLRAAQACARLPLHEALNETGVNESGAPVRFVAHTELAQGEAYESHIFRTRSCPTRSNLHDFLNGLCWIEFPLSKARLNELQAGEIARGGIGAARGPVRDAITILDENGALLHAPPEIWDALQAREWRRLFVDLRPLWDEARLVMFGHALLEKLATQPRKDLTAHVWCTPMPSGRAGEMDSALCESLSPARLAAKPFTPLPVMGIPGWCAQNQNFSFYDDSFVFRPAGHRTKQNTPVRRPGS